MSFLASILARYRSKQNPEQLTSLSFPPDCTQQEASILSLVKNCTMTSIERQLSLCRIVDFILDNGIEGDFVECGVWKGGSAMIAALKFVAASSAKKLWLYDTFSGMPPAEDKHDFSYENKNANLILHEEEVFKDSSVVWAIGPLDVVKNNLSMTGIPENQVVYIQGMIEETVPASNMPASISILRLDTDWYSSTLHELKYFYQLVSPGGFIIIDDYGHWDGARKAVDEFLAQLPEKPFLHRVDYSCRVIQKP